MAERNDDLDIMDVEQAVREVVQGVLADNVIALRKVPFLPLLLRLIPAL